MTSSAQKLVVASTSTASDNAYRSMADLAAVTDRVARQWRLIGGQMVTLHLLRTGVEVHVRETADTDLGADFFAPCITPWPSSI